MIVRVFRAAVRLGVQHLAAACCHFLIIYRGTGLTEVRSVGQDDEEAAMRFAIEGLLRRARNVQRKGALMRKLMGRARGLTVAGGLQTHEGRAG